MSSSFGKRLTYPLITGLVLIIAAIAGFIYFDRMMSEPIEIKNVNIDTSAALKLDRLNQISKRDGITEWELSAASATLLKDENKAVLNSVSVFFFTEDEKKIHLTSAKGILNTQTHDMIFTDQVVVRYQDSVLKTDKLQYIKKEHIIRSDTRVTLEKGLSVIEADTMTTRLNDNVTILQGDVKGKFSETFDLQ